MTNDLKQGSPDIIQAYLSYLQEMSRKITSRSGMENVLYRKTKRNSHYYLPANLINSNYLKQVISYTEKEPDKQLFLGNGLVVGVIKKKGIKKYIASPLIYCVVNIDTNDSSKSFTDEVDFDSASLNYDLFTLVLEKDSDEEAAIENNEFSNQLINQPNLEVLERIKQDIEKYLEHQDSIEQLGSVSTSKEFFQQIKSEVAEFKQATISENDFTLNKLDELIKTERLTFFSHLFFYVANLPGQLSTYTALRKLIKEAR